MKKASVLLLFIACYNLLLAQDIKQDLAKLNQTHSGKEFYAEINYKYFTGNTLTEESNAIHIQSNGSYYFKIKDFEIINNTKCQVMVDHFSKSISVMPSGKKNSYSETTKIPIDSALKGATSYRYKNISDKVGAYSISLKKGEYKTIEIYFDKKSYTITKLRMHVSDAYGKQDTDLADGILEVIYKKFSKTVSKNNKNLLQETTFVHIKRGSISLLPAYKEYELKNYLNIKPE